MNKKLFYLELTEIGWYNDEDDAPYDSCAHGFVKVIIDNQIIVSPEAWLNVSACGLHLLRTLDSNHTEKAPLFGYILTEEGHHLDYLPNDKVVTIETLYPSGYGYNWWVKHNNGQTTLTTESNNSVTITFDEYSSQIIKFVERIEELFSRSTKKLIKETEYDQRAYLMFKNEWRRLKKMYK